MLIEYCPLQFTYLNAETQKFLPPGLHNKPGLGGKILAPLDPTPTSSCNRIVWRHSRWFDCFIMHFTELTALTEENIELDLEVQQFSSIKLKLNQLSYSHLV